MCHQVPQLSTKKINMPNKLRHQWDLPNSTRIDRFLRRVANESSAERTVELK